MVLLLFMYCILISYNVQNSLTKRIIVDRITKKLANRGVGEGAV